MGYRAFSSAVEHPVYIREAGGSNPSVRTNIMFSKREKGFTLIELLVVIGIIGLIASITLVSLRDSREKGKAANAGGTARNLRLATELYYADMGFYPPDVNRGWDPGFTHRLPYNPDTDQTTTPACPHCPANWTTILNQKWNGPYISFWPQSTLWGGKYDFNYWDVGTNRYGCIVAPGIYIGIQGDYSNQHTIPAYAEQLMIDQQYDSDGCLNGESQMILIDL